MSDSIFSFFTKSKSDQTSFPPTSSNVVDNLTNDNTISDEQLSSARPRSNAVIDDSSVGLETANKTLQNENQALQNEKQALQNEKEELQKRLGIRTTGKKEWYDWLLQKSICIPRILFLLIFLGVLITLIVLVEEERKRSNFENKEYDPFGTGIRFLQRRDDTGSPSTSLDERQYYPMVSQLTSNPEPPNFSEYYGIDASIKNGSVMIERENFENSALSMDELEKANKGL